jgi:hypothetical protein
MVAVGVVLYLLDLRSRKKHPGQAAEPGGGQPAATPTCADTTCALHDLCPSEAIMQCAVSNEIVYYDDEELDAFKGRGARDYTEAEIEQFRDVLYTLKPADLLGWEQSVTKRGIVLPTSIRDEFIALYNDAKTSN